MLEQEFILSALMLKQVLNTLKIVNWNNFTKWFYSV